MRVYTFNNDSWIDTPVCDCCHYEDLMEVFNIDRDKHPEFYQNGSAHSLDECFEDVLIHEEILEEDWSSGDPDMNWEEELLFLQDLMEKNRLQVRIEDFDNPGEYNVYP